MNTRELKERAESKINNLIDALEMLGKDITEAIRLSFAVLKANDYADFCDIDRKASELIGSESYLYDMIQEPELETENN